jgi:asparagine synthase (glutamine-hydrolysing)
VLAELSGGLDSSSIVCVADDLMAKNEIKAPQIETFSYFDSNEPGEDDLSHFNAVEQKRGRPGLHFDLKGSGDSLPLHDTEFVAMPGFRCRAEIKAAISEITRYDKYRVLLCGLGGDEMNGQCLDPRVQLAELVTQFRWGEFTQLLVAWALRMRLPLLHLFLQTGQQFLPVALRARLVRRGRTEPWIQSAFARSQNMSGRQLEGLPAAHFMQPARRDAMQTLETLSRQLTHSAPSLLERRYPFLDRDLVEFLTTIPLEQLLRPGERRSLMRRSLRHMLPAEVAVRRTKTSAGRCYPISLAKHWSEIEALLESPISEALGYIDRNALKNVLLEMKNGRLSPTFLRVLKALSLEKWLRDGTARGVWSVDSRCAPQIRGTYQGKRTSENSTPAASTAVDI